MLFRRSFLQGTSACVAIPALCRNLLAADSPSLKGNQLSAMGGPNEDIVEYVHRLTGGWSADLYKRILGAANEFKEGDEIVGVAAADESSRKIARQLLANTSLAALQNHPLQDDAVHRYSEQARDKSAAQNAPFETVGQLKTWMLSASEAEIHSVKAGLSSDAIACLVKLMSNQELILLSSKVFNPLPGSRIGARGYLGARVQPNSPTDNLDDIRWQVFDAFSYAVGDVLLGTNPVSSNPESVLAVELALQDVLETFGISDAMPHCVLSHIDVQAEVENRTPGSTALWFQSIAGSDAANATFDVTVEKMQKYAREQKKRFSLYFETGQGADFTNGHALGYDMVIHESRKYGFARALVLETRRAKGGQDVWTHVNDVAGFIGPEVFRTREQLVRCCLEDLVMGKLHGLTIGLDVCATLHMDISPADLDWCLSQIAPACPAYLMALPTKIDPMLGYLTTGYQDHVRLREEHGFRVNDRMWAFFEELQVVDHLARPTKHFGDPAWVYLQYRRRKGDTRTDSEIRNEAGLQIEAVRQRGVFIAEGHGRKPSDLQPGLERKITQIYDDAKQCIWRQWDQGFLQRLPQSIYLDTESKDRNDYILHPATGEVLASKSKDLLDQWKSKHRGQPWNALIVVSDGLNALALMDEGNLIPLVEAIQAECHSHQLHLPKELFVVNSGRVRAGYRIGEQLFADRQGPCTLFHVIGERPGSGHHTLSVYITRVLGTTWGRAGSVDHDKTRVVSGISTTALIPQKAAVEISRIMREPVAG